MSLVAPPLTRALPHPGEPFVVYAIWGYQPGLKEVSPWDVPEELDLIGFAAANLPGAALGEFAVMGSLAYPLSQVHPSELPIALSLRLDTENRVWRFDYLGSRESFGQIWQIPTDVQPVAPTPLTLEELNQGAEEMVRESLGLPPDVAIPEPEGQLPPEEASEEPYRFDPTRHMDLSMAEAAPPLPDPAAPGPDPASGAQQFFAPPLPEPQGKRHGAYGDASVPFAH